MMKLYYGLFLLAAMSLLFSCNKDEGVGGSSSIEGYVYQIRHWNKDYSRIIDTVPALDVRVQIAYGGDLGSFLGDDDIRTDANGLYRFNYLREGNYIVSAFSELSDGQLRGEYKEVRLNRNVVRVDTLFVSSIVKDGLASVRGYVKAQYYDNGRLIDEGPAIEQRIFIKVFGALSSFEDVRASDLGYFVFEGIMPGKYEVWAVSEDPETERLDPVKQVIEVTGKEGIYEFEEEFVVKRAV